MTDAISERARALQLELLEAGLTIAKLKAEPDSPRRRSEIAGTREVMAILNYEFRREIGAMAYR